MVRSRCLETVGRVFVFYGLRGKGGALRKKTIRVLI